MIAKKLWLKITLFILVFLFTFALRSHNYDRTPLPDHLDEMLYAWSGIHLIETGVPVSWSTLDYPERAQVFEGIRDYKGGEPSASVTLYKPWVDEPPLFSYLVGYFAHYFGADRDEFIPASHIRFPIIFISALTSILVFLVAKKLFGFSMGLLSMLLYGTIPTIVFSSRVAMPENFIALCYMFSIYLLILFKEKKSYWYIAGIPVIAGIAGLAKPTGLFIIFFASFIVFKELYRKGKWRNAVKIPLLMLVGVIPFVIFYFWWGLHLDSEIFWIINGIQSHRPVGFNSLTWLVISPSYGTKIIKDGWFVFSLLSAFYFFLSKQNKNIKFISLALIYWILVVMISGGEADLLAWYRFPTYPLIAITGALGLKILYDRADFFATFVGMGLLLGNRTLTVNAFRPNIAPNMYRFIMSVGLLPSLSGLVFKKDWLLKLSRAILVLVMVVGIIINIYYIENAFDILCENVHCPIVEPTFLSTLFIPQLKVLFGL